MHDRGTQTRWSPELAARRIAAAAVLADYLRAADGASTADLALWAVRMASMLAHVLAVLSDGDQEAVHLAEVRAVLGAFDWESGDRQYALQRIDVIVNRGRP
jgi:hypothetical protein